MMRRWPVQRLDPRRVRRWPSAGQDDRARTSSRHARALPLFAFVILWGLSGIFATSLWLGPLLQRPLDRVDETVAATFRNELRFLEARELGVGLFTLFFEDEILGSRKHNLVFLAVVLAAPLARTFAILADGAPSPIWLGRMASEIAMALAIAIATRCVRRTDGAAASPLQPPSPGDS